MKTNKDLSNQPAINLPPQEEGQQLTHREYMGQIKRDEKLGREVKQMQTKAKSSSLQLSPQQREVQSRQNNMTPNSKGNQAEKESITNPYIKLRAKACKNQLERWEQKKTKNDYKGVEKEILKQILQDEFALEQREFWLRRDRQKSSRLNRVQKKELQQLGQVQQKQNSQFITLQQQSSELNQEKPNKAGFSIQNIGENLQQKAQRTHSMRQRDAMASPLKRQAKYQNISELYYVDGKDSGKQLPQMKQSSVSNECRTNVPSVLRERNTLSSYYIEKLFKGERKESIQQQKDRSLLNITSSFIPSSTISQKEINRDFAFRDPHSRLIIMVLYILNYFQFIKLKQKTFNYCTTKRQQEKGSLSDWNDLYKPQSLDPGDILNDLQVHTESKSLREIQKLGIQRPKSDCMTHRQDYQIFPYKSKK